MKISDKYKSTKVSFGYPPDLGVYATSTSDIPELGEIDYRRMMLDDTNS